MGGAVWYWSGEPQRDVGRVGGPSGGPGRFGGPTRRYRTGLRTMWEVWIGLEDSRCGADWVGEVQDGSRDPREGPGRVGDPRGGS